MGEEFINGDEDKEHQDIDLKSVYRFLSKHMYPPELTKNQKANFRRQCKPFSLSDEGKLMYTRTPRGKTSDGEGSKSVREVILSREEQLTLIKNCHEGMGSSIEAKALAGHHGRDITLKHLSKRFYWKSMSGDVRKYCASCMVCQQANPATLKVRQPMYCVCRI